MRIVIAVLLVSHLVLGEEVPAQKTEVAETCDAKGKVLLQKSHEKKLVSSRDHESISDQESLGFFTEDDEAWKARKELHHAWMNRQDNASTQFASTNKILEAGRYWQYHFEPSFHCDLAERIGNVGDGGKWICNPGVIRQAVKRGGSCLIYSVGSNGQFDFEQGVVDDISPDCEIHIFDPSRPGKVAEVYNADRHIEKPRQATYHQLALGVDGAPNVFGAGVPTKSISTIVKELGHEGRWIDVFKIDCEGCEYEVFKDFKKQGLKIRQIQSEIHMPSNNHLLELYTHKANPLFKDLFEAGYVMFNKEANLLAHGTCVEFAFLKLGPSF